MGKCIFGIMGWGGREEKGKRDREIFGLCMGRDVIWNIP